MAEYKLQAEISSHIVTPLASIVKFQACLISNTSCQHAYND